MEEITLIGNLGSDPDVRYTNGGEKVVSFSLAVQAGKKAQGEALAHWYTCDAWERLADICEQYLRKGSKVLVRGLPRAEAYQSKRDGKPRAALKVTRAVRSLSGMEPRPAGKAGRQVCGPGQARGNNGVHPGQLGQEKQKEGEACHRVTLRRRYGAHSIFFTGCGSGRSIARGIWRDVRWLASLGGWWT